MKLMELAPRLLFETRTMMGLNLPRIVFLHIPRCGGTTVDNYFFRHLGRPKVGRSAVAESADDLPADIARIRYVTGHFNWSVAEAMIPGSYSFTVLREPVERLWSAYFYVRNRRKLRDTREIGFVDFCREDRYGIVNQFGGSVDAAMANLSRLHRVILLPDLDVALREIATRFNLPAPADQRFNTTHNVLPANEAKRFAEGPTRAEHKAVEDMLRGDVEVYRAYASG